MKKLILLFLCFVFTGCAYFGTVRGKVDGSQFQNENLPIRMLRLYVFSDDSYSEKYIRDTIQEASEISLKQTGIGFEIYKFKFHTWNGISIWKWKNMIKDSKNLTRDENDKFDMSLAISGYNPIGFLLWHLQGTGAIGYCEDNLRRYTAFKLFNTWSCLHEIYHGFIFSHPHSLTGMMVSGFQIIKLPIIPLTINTTNWLSNGDRREVLKNKWRDFKISPWKLKGESKMDWDNATIITHEGKELK